MPTIQELRSKIPALNGLDDRHAVEYIQRVHYPTRTADEIAQSLGVKSDEAPAEATSLIRRIAGDGLVTAAKGAIGVPEAVVGLADIATGGRVGQVLENADGDYGFRPKEAKAYLDTLYSKDQKDAFKAVQGAADPNAPFLMRAGQIAGAAITHPSTIAHAVGESLPAMGAGGVIGRGVMALAPRVAGFAAGGIGEGAISAGQTAEQIRQGTSDGRLTGEQAAVAAGSGALTGALGILAGKVANKLGIGDIDTMMAGGAHVAPDLQKGFVRKMLEGAFSEGVLEELPQSVQEQVAQNYALGKPLDEGVDQAAVMGVLSGGAMGAGAQLIHQQPNTGPLARAANMAAAGVAPVAPTAPTAPSAPFAPVAPVLLAPEQEKMLLDYANRRTRELNEKAKGTKDEKTTGPEGKPVTIAGKQPEYLTPQEKAELEFLTQAGGDAQALHRAYGNPANAAPPTPPAAPGAQTNVDAQAHEPATLGAEPSATAPDSPAPSAMPATPQSPTPAEPAGKPVAPVVAETAGVASAEDDLDQNPPHAVGDILSPRGKPFEFRAQAAVALRKQDNPLDFTIERVNGGYTLRKRSDETTEPADSPVNPAPEVGDEDEAKVAAPEGVPKVGATPLPGSATAGATIGEQGVTLRPAGTTGYSADDILNPNGEPFKTKAAAAVAQKKAGGTLAEVPGGWVVRPQPTELSGAAIEQQRPAGTRGTTAADVLPTGNVSPPNAEADTVSATAQPETEGTQAPTTAGGDDARGDAVGANGLPAEPSTGDVQADGLTGEPIDAEWTAFSKESGTIGKPRAEMPQIKAEHRGAMVQFLKGRGITHEQEHEVDPGTLKPTQAEFSPGKVAKARAFEGGDRAILVSSDNHVLDGHHQWMAAIADKKPVRVIRLDAPIAKLLDEVREFPSAEASDGATPAAAPHPVAAEWDSSKPSMRKMMLMEAGIVDKAKTEAHAVKAWAELPDDVRAALSPTPMPTEPAAPAEPTPMPTGAGTPTGDVKTPKEPKTPKPVVEPLSKEERAELLKKFDDAPVDSTIKFKGKAYAKRTGSTWKEVDNAEAQALASSYFVDAGHRAAPKHPKAEPKPADTMAELIDGSDAQGIADKAYQGVREAQPEDFPLVLADDRLIRLPVLTAEREAVEANLKKLKFRVTDRSQESAEAGRVVVSAIYRPDAGTVGDAGEQMAGGRKEQPAPNAPKDPTEKQLDDFLADIHPAKHVNADTNAEQSFGAMMLKEALFENLKSPLTYLSDVVSQTYGDYFGMRSGRAILKKALTVDRQRERVQTLAAGYVERLTLLQATLTPANRVADVVKAFADTYTEERYGTTRLKTGAGTELQAVSSGRPNEIIDRLAPKFEPTEDSTSQVHRVKKKDPDAPPRLERIIRIGMKDHRGGKDVADDDFLATFGFRGLEFGNWVNQVERQANLNLAYDSLMDLSDLTGLSPKALGLAQKLGFAIGSRGQNPSAAAHFEPDNNVINLTKTKGNGTVGHEWFHALDHNANGVQDGDYKVAQLARNMVNTLTEALKQRVSVDAGDAFLRDLLRQGTNDAARNTPPKQAVFEAIVGGKRYRYGTPDAYSNYVREKTKFFADAEKMDDGADKKYWSTGVELLARGFETFLFDKSKGGSPYLVGPSRGDGVMTDENGYKGTAYPAGAERAYVAGLFAKFLEQFDGETLQIKPYTAKYTVTEVPGIGWTVLDQHGVDPSSTDGRMIASEDEKTARDRAALTTAPRYLNVEKITNGELNLHYRKFALDIDKIMDEMGLERWPELKDGSMAESMFFHLRQGWWPKDNQALKVYAGKAFGIAAKDVDLLKLKQAQEDFEAALGRYGAQRVVDLRSTGSDSRAIYDYLVDLYKRQPNLDVRTSTSVTNQAYSTPLTIGFVAGLMGHVDSKSTVFDATGGNGMLVMSANPKRVIAIELDPHRANNMRLMEYGKVIEGDATKLIATNIRSQEADVNLFNPPFGPLAQSVAVPSWDGRNFLMGKIDQLIAAQGMKAMADKGRAVIILGAHKLPGTVTSTDRVFLNWLYSNYNVADHFEIDGSLYSRQGASFPLRVLVVAGRNETVSAFPIDTVVDRVNDFEQLWSRSDEARKRAGTVLVGAGRKVDDAGGANRQPDAVPAGNQGQAPGAAEAGGANGSGVDRSDGADGAAGAGSATNGQPGRSGGSTAGDGERGGTGSVGGAGNGEAGGTGRSAGRRGGSAGTPVGGLSGLTDDDLDSLIADAMGGEKKPRAPKAPAGETVTSEPAAPRAPRAKPKPGVSILDSIPGMSDLLGQLGAEFGIASNDSPDDTPPEPKKKRETAVERRERLKAGAVEKSAPVAEAAVARGRPDYMPADFLNLLSQHRYSATQIAKAAQAALDYQLEQAQNPTAPTERVSSRAMFSRQMQEDAQYAKVQPILAAIWQRLTAAITDVGSRIKTFVVGAAQKFGNTVVPFVKRFIQDLRSEEITIPDGKRPIRAEAIDNAAQVVYRGRSTGDSAGIFVPRNQATALERSFDAFEAENGEVDQYVMRELGYKSLDDMHKGPKRGQSQGLAGYQVDALALAIGSMKRGDGFIIGDDTGVGKGRTAAALIAWAVKNGKVPIFFSYKADLYSAMHDDITDIGMDDVVKPLPTDSDAVIKNRKGKTVLKNDAKTAKKALDHIIKNGAMPDGANALFTTYYQNNKPNKRREAISRLVRDGKAVLVLDEAHNAAGESGTNEFFMSLLTGQGMFGGNEKDGFASPPDDWIAPQTAYLTATFAKRPSNMPVYIRTQLRHAANTPQELTALFSTGGDVLQQIASEMLVSSGSMIRRERSYAGVKFNYVTDEANAPRDARDVDAATTVLRQIVYADRAFGSWVKSTEGASEVATLMPPGFAAISSGSKADVAINKSEFTSVVHNYVGQLLLATKVDKAVELAVAALNAGQKPVLTLQNTMEAALNDFVSNEKIAEGDALEGFGWQSILKRGITSARRVVFDAGTGDKNDNVRVIVPVSFMPPLIAAEFKKADALIAKFHSELPGSPIDALRHRLSKYSIVETTAEDGSVTYAATTKPAEGSKHRPLVAVEVTGREFGVDYSQPSPTYMRREDPDNIAIIRGFQGGSREDGIKAPPIDVVILNSSGSTGISLHASEMAIDQRPRHMIVLQPNPDIAVFKQTTGRIHRTGQVEWPHFTVLATGIPAERRQLAMLKKKIGSLFSNTSSGEGTTNVDAVDFINQYGDVITASYLEDNEDVAAFIGLKPTKEPAGSDIARKASGRAALLSVDEQRDYFDTIEQQFLMEIEQRNATGTNALARRAMDFQASPVEMQVLEEGMDETNPFTSSAYITKFEVNVIGDIPTAEKVKAAVESALGGTTREATLQRLVKSLETRYDEARNQLTLRMNEIVGSIAKEDATEQEKLALTKRRDALQKTVKGFAERREATIRTLSSNLLIGSGASSMTVGDVESSAVVVGVTAGKSTSKVGNPFAPSNIIIHFQRNIPSGRLSVPLTKIENEEYQLDGWTRRPDIDDWFGLRNVSGGRKERWIASGNLLRARSIVNGGEIMLHTMQGSTEQAPIEQGGILMPQAYQPGTESKSDFTIRYPGAAVDYIMALQKASALQRGERYKDEAYLGRARAFADTARFQAEIDPAVMKSIAESGAVLAGPARGWSIDMSPYDGKLRLYVGKNFPRIVKSKDLKALGMNLAKKRSSDSFEDSMPDDPAAIKAVIKIIGNLSPLVAPDQAADVVRELSRQHFQADNAPKTDAPAASMGSSSGGQPAADVQATVDGITANWQGAPEVVVARSFADPSIPASVRSDLQALLSQGAEGAPEGVFHEGKVYLIADKLGSAADTVRVLMHEALGHFGMRGVFGADFGKMLDRMAMLNSSKVRDAARKLGYDFEKQSERRLAAEEVLAYMAQETPALGWVGRAVAAVKTWAREHIPGFGKMALSDSELIRDFIVPARRFVTEGRAEGVKRFTRGAVFSRQLAAPLMAAANSARDVKLPAGYVLGDLFNGAAGRVNWWHKTVGTPYNLAQKNASFRRVYDGIQTFLNDVSYYATESADLAPSLLPKLDRATDALPAMTLLGKKIGKSPMSPADTKALSAPVFEGTLAWGRDRNGKARPIAEIEADLGATALDDKAHMLVRANHVDPKVLRMWQGLPMEQYESIIENKFEQEFLKPGVVFTPEELKTHFNMTDVQIGHYQEFRTATDRSITQLAISDMLRFGGADVAGLREDALATNDIGKASIMLRDALFQLAADNPDRADHFNDIGNTMIVKADKAQGLIDHGYAPLSRFGQYTLDVLDADGKRVYFGMFEGTIDRAKMARKMAEQFPGSTINQGTVSQEAYKLFAGVSPETLELFGEMLGLEAGGNDEANKAFQTYLKVARSSRDAIKRLIKRKGTAGFSEDAGRVLAGFVYSNARQTSNNLHMGEIDRAVRDIPQGDGQIADQAMKLRDYVKNPQEEAQAFRGILFAQYLGGSIASAMVNATQPFAVTFPYLSQFGGAVKAAKQMAAAAKDATKDKTGDAALDAALKRAEEDGIVSPQEVHALMAQAMGKAQLKSGDGTLGGNALAHVSNASSKLSLAWGKVFGLAEQFNRRTTFIAAYRTAVDQKIAEPAKFAAKAVAETQFTYNKGNKPAWARGTAGSILFTFKQYGVNYLEMLHRMATAGEPGSAERRAGQRAALLALAVLFLMAGADGLPFMEDAEDLIDGAMQRLGYNFSSKQKLKEFFTGVVGHGGAEFIMSGVSGLPGAPIDVSGRLGMGNLIPGTGLFQKKADHTRDLLEFAGPAGDFGKRGLMAADQALSGDLIAAHTTISPTAARNLAKAYEMSQTGEYRDDKGRKVVDTTLGEAIAKGIGFQPRSVKDVQEATSEVQRQKAGYQLAASEIRDKWARALHSGDKDALQDARNDLAEWNSKNPEQPIKPNMPAILRRVREMKKTKAERVADNAPKAIRQQVKAQLAEELK